MTSFELTCACGQTLRGERHRRHQLVSCHVCGRSAFVFPLSPYDLPTEAARPAPKWRSSWRTPVIAAVGSILLLVVSFALAWPYLMRRPVSIVEESNARNLLGESEAGRIALSKGKFHLGRRLLAEVLARRDLQPTLLTAEQNRDLNRLHGQADLLARLSNRSLEEIVRQGMLVRDPEEWAAQFADYRGRTIIFDDLFLRDPYARPATDVVEIGQEVVRLAFEELVLLQDLPLNDSPRLIFGARMAGCRREEGGVWVVRFDPNSGVLLTDPELWQACASGDLDDDTRRVFARQRQWVEQSVLGGPLQRNP